MRSLSSLLAASVILLAPLIACAGQEENEETSRAWETLAPGYYVEQDAKGIADCTRPANTNWLYIGPEVRKDAEIFDYFGMPGAIGFNFGGATKDYLLREVMVMAPPEDDNMLEIIRKSMNGKNPIMLRGTGLSRGGLDVSTKGKLSGHFSMGIDTGFLHIHSLSFSDYVETQDFVEPSDGTTANPSPDGKWPDGPALRPFEYCPAE